MRGGYCLVLCLDAQTRIETRGKTFDLPPGTYAYCGSALNSLEARIERHARNFRGGQLKRFWHIDYLLPHSANLTIIKAPAGSSIECKTASKLREKGLVPVPGFGGSDCRSGCGGHLLFSDGAYGSTIGLVVASLSELGLKPEVQTLKAPKSL